MRAEDAELERFRREVNCAALLERLPPPWRLDRTGSTSRALKYRRGAGEILIVNHDGCGWWDPRSAAKGDIFDLVQFLDPRLNFGQVRQILGRFVGHRPDLPGCPAVRAKRRAPDRPLQERWTSRPRLRRGSQVWRYLTEERRLPASVLAAADGADALREGRTAAPGLRTATKPASATHIEIRGPGLQRLA